MKLEKRVVRTIWEVKWPENISPTKLAKALGVTWSAAKAWIVNDTLPSRWIPIVEKIPLKDLLKDEKPESSKE
jgi:hypothetical protein